MVEVFKTNVENETEAQAVSMVLMHMFPDTRINFDLDDVDKILRIQSDKIYKDFVMKTVNDIGFKCELLPE